MDKGVSITLNATTGWYPYTYNNSNHITVYSKPSGEIIYCGTILFNLREKATLFQSYIIPNTLVLFDTETTPRVVSPIPEVNGFSNNTTTSGTGRFTDFSIRRWRAGLDLTFRIFSSAGFSSVSTGTDVVSTIKGWKPYGSYKVDNVLMFRTPTPPTHDELPYLYSDLYDAIPANWGPLDLVHIASAIQYQGAQRNYQNLRMVFSHVLHINNTNMYYGFGMSKSDSPESILAILQRGAFIHNGVLPGVGVGVGARTPHLLCGSRLASPNLLSPMPAHSYTISRWEDLLKNYKVIEVIYGSESVAITGFHKNQVFDSATSLTVGWANYNKLEATTQLSAPDTLNTYPHPMSYTKGVSNTKESLIAHPLIPSYRSLGAIPAMNAITPTRTVTNHKEKIEFNIPYNILNGSIDIGGVIRAASFSSQWVDPVYVYNITVAAANRPTIAITGYKRHPITTETTWSGYAFKRNII